MSKDKTRLYKSRYEKVCKEVHELRERVKEQDFEIITLARELKACRDTQVSCNSTANMMIEQLHEGRDMVLEIVELMSSEDVQRLKMDTRLFYVQGTRTYERAKEFQRNGDSTYEKLLHAVLN